jgi:hypothetical protein
VTRQGQEKTRRQPFWIGSGEEVITVVWVKMMMDWTREVAMEMYLNLIINITNSLL